MKNKKPLWQMILDGEASELDIARSHRETAEHLAKARLKSDQAAALERAKRVMQSVPSAILLFRRK